MAPNYRQIKAIEAANKKRILKVCPDCPETSGIYFILREEDGFRYGYIGKAKHLLTRLAQHLTGYQRIDLSIKKRGLWSEENPTGYKIHFLRFPEAELDDKEQYFIKKYANAGWQLRNVESGGTKGKTVLDEKRPVKGYHDGLKQGEKNAKRFVADLFSKHLDFVPKRQPPTKLQIRAMEKFEEFLKEDE